MATTVTLETLGYSVTLRLEAIFTSIVVIIHLVYVDDLDHSRHLVNRLKQAGKSTMAVIRQLPRGGPIYVIRVANQVRRVVLGSDRELFSDTSSVNSAAIDVQEDDVILNMRLKNGKTVQVKIDDLEEFLQNNQDEVVMQHHKARGKRRSDPAEWDFTTCEPGIN